MRCRYAPQALGRTFNLAASRLALPLLPKRALTLAQELLTRGVQAIKADPEAPWAPGHARADPP